MKKQKAERNKLKNPKGKNLNKGITLIALIITIIVLLILAGVSIATLTGDNGVLTKAADARNENRKAEAKELVQLEAIASYGEDGKVDIDEFKKNLKKNLGLTDGNIADTNGGFPVTVTYENYEFIIEEAGDVEISESEIRINEFAVKGTEVKTVPVPEGFVHVGGTIEEGYVISDNLNDANKGVNSTELQGNQFVWVPVEKNQKVRINVSSKKEIESIVVTDPFGDELELPEVSGKEYVAEVNPTINGYYNMTITTASEVKERMIDVKSLYATRMWEVDRLASDKLAKSNGYDNALDLINDIFSEYGSFSSVEQAIKMSKLLFKQQYSVYAETEEIDHVAKVNNNGGFYIGRYEATYEKVDEVEKVASKKATVASRINDSTPLANGMLWNWISQIDALEKAKAYNGSLSSTLPTGAAWDRTLCWLIETKEKTVDEIAVDSKGWGNYDDDNFSNTTGLIKPGEFEETEANNIYDLAGNVEEWTTESYNTTWRFHRGGNYNSDGSNCPASYRYESGPAVGYTYIGLRLTLFL